MAPIKFEEDLKTTIEQRTITPSENAWEKLNSSLQAQEKKGKNRTSLWLGIAASVVGIIWLVSAVFYTNNEVAPVIVDTDDINQLPKVEPTIQEENIQNEVLIAETIVEEEIQKEEPIKEFTIVKDDKTELVAQIQVDEIELHDSQLIEMEEAQPDELFEVATQIVAINEEKPSVSEAEIDSLLLEAQLRIAKKKIEESGISISAYALLFEVEEELDPSFKEKVFNVISKNYNSIKNAVATRND